MNEAEAYRKLKRQDEKALEWFIEHYTPYVSTIIYNIIGTFSSSSDIEEISSDVFLTLWKNADRVPAGKVKAYLGGIARNKAKEHTRRMRNDIPLDDDLILIADDNLERDFEEQELVSFLNKTIRAMGEPDREIFIRHYYYFQSISTIAEEMNMNPSTVKIRLFRGREKLKKSIVKGGFIIEN